VIGARIAVIPGDGIGQEVVPVAVEAVRAAAAADGIAIAFDQFPWAARITSARA